MTTIGQLALFIQNTVLLLLLMMMMIYYSTCVIRDRFDDTLCKSALYLLTYSSTVPRGQTHFSAFITLKDTLHGVTFILLVLIFLLKRLLWCCWLVQREGHPVCISSATTIPKNLLFGTGLNWSNSEKMSLLSVCVSAWKDCLRWMRLSGSTLTHATPWWVISRLATLPWKSLKVLDFFPFFEALESPWKRIWCLKVLEFIVRGPWKCLSSKIVCNFVMWKWCTGCSKWRTVSNIVNFSITYWVYAVNAVLRAENYDGIGLKKIARMRESPWKVLDFISPKGVAILNITFIWFLQFSMC